MKIGRLIAVVKSDEVILKQAVGLAEESGEVE